MIDRVDAVAIADVRELAHELFAPRRLSVAGIGPSRSHFEGAIGALGAAAPASDVKVSRS